MTTSERLQAIRRLLAGGDNESARDEIASLFSAGVAHESIVGVLLDRSSDRAIADGSWLPAASVTSLACSLKHVALQHAADKHKLLAFGERSPNFRRIESLTPLTGDQDVLRIRFAEAADGHDEILAERCLLGIEKLGGVGDVFGVVLDRLLNPQYLGETAGPWWSGVRHQCIGYAIELWKRFGDAAIKPWICNRGAHLCAAQIGEPKEPRAKMMESLVAEYQTLDAISDATGRSVDFDEAAFRQNLRSNDGAAIFYAITNAWRNGVSIDQLTLAMTMHCVERLERAGYGGSANWDNLKRELLSTAAARRIQTFDANRAVKAIYHAGWQFVRHGDEALGDRAVEESGETDRQPRTIAPSDECEIDYSKPNTGIGRVSSCIVFSDPIGALNVANDYVAREHDGDEFLRQINLFIETYSSSGYYAGRSGLIDAWQWAKEHPERNRILVAQAGWAADYHRQHFNHRRKHGPIWGGNVSDDGSLFAIRSAGTRVYETTTGKELMFFPGSPWRFAFSPNSRWLACGWDATTEGMTAKVQVFDLITRQAIAELKGFGAQGKVWGMCFSPDGSMLAIAGRNDPNVQIWDTATWQMKFELVGHQHHRNESVTFTADSATIATGGNDGTVRIWDANSGQSIRVFDGHAGKNGRISGLQFHPNGEHIVSAKCDGEVKVWLWRSGEELWTKSVPHYCNYAGFTPDGEFGISEHGGVLHYWNAATGEQSGELQTIPRKHNDHTIFGGANQSRDRSTILTAGWHGKIQVWDATTRQKTLEFDLTI